MKKIMFGLSVVTACLGLVAACNAGPTGAGADCPTWTEPHSVILVPNPDHIGVGVGPAKDHGAMRTIQLKTPSQTKRAT